MKIIIFLLLAIVSSVAFSKAGPEIPRPKFSYQVAHDLAHKALLTQKDNIDPKYAKAEDYILGSIKYRKVENNWVWVVMFFHPKANDHTVTYYINLQGLVTLYAATE